MSGRKLGLGVNIDHVATLRQARGGQLPDPIEAALLAERSGADSITLHLREDRRHIQDRDVMLMRNALTTRMNLEMAVTEEMLAQAERLRPADVCLVPERRQELTTEGGLDVIRGAAEIGAACARLGAAGIRVSLFIDPDPAQIEASKAAGAAAIEMHTGAYAHAYGQAGGPAELQRLIDGARRAAAMGLIVNAGHGLDYQNVKPVAAIAQLTELNIGHSIISRALFTGLAGAVAEMKKLMQEASAR